MLPLAWHTLDSWFRNAAPVALAFALILVGVVPWPLPGLTSVAPMFGLIAVHYWTVHRPEVMPTAAAFGLGLAHDILGGAPVGLNAFVLVLAWALVTSQRRHLVRRPFVVDWCGFAMIAAAIVVAIWVTGSLYFVQPLGAEPLLVQYLLTVSAYPAFAWLFGRLRVRLFRKQANASGI